MCVCVCEREKREYIYQWLTCPPMILNYNNYVNTFYVHTWKRRIQSWIFRRKKLHLEKRKQKKGLRNHVTSFVLRRKVHRNVNEDRFFHTRCALLCWSFALKDVTNYKTINYVTNMSLYMSKRLHSNTTKIIWNIYASNTILMDKRPTEGRPILLTWTEDSRSCR